MCGQRAEGQGQKPSHSAGTCIKGQGRVGGVSLPWPQLAAVEGLWPRTLAEAYQVIRCWSLWHETCLLVPWGVGFMA